MAFSSAVNSIGTSELIEFGGFFGSKEIIQEYD